MSPKKKQKQDWEDEFECDEFECDEFECDEWEEDELTLEDYEIVLDFLNNYWKEHPNAIAYPDWEKKITTDWIAPILGRTERHLQLVLEDLFSTGMEVPHSYSCSFVNDTQLNLETRILLDDKIYYLKSQPQPEQRTQAWQDVRRNHLTASNAYKAFGSPAAVNSLIYEKCIPTKEERNEDRGFAIKVNIEDARHKGQKYEPISCQLYEWFYQTKVGEFGCLIHPTYNFLGASPDGINIDPKNKRFGRMLEIKNVQVITENPKLEYWVQTQIQMEVCDLEECDFLETRFEEINQHEYEQNQSTIDPNKVAEREWYRGGDNGDIRLCIGMTGLYLMFLEEGYPKYVYRPLECLDGEDTFFWIHQMLRNHSHWDYYGTFYWKLTGIGCVFVPRNRIWFQRNVTQLTRVWEIILTERETGDYIQRAPKKRTPKPAVCLIKLPLHEVPSK